MSFCSNHILFSSTYPITSAKQSKTNSPLLRICLARNQKISVSGSYNDETKIELPAGLEAELMPKHVAVIMDGNRRWAKSKGLPVHHGHLAGRKAFELLCQTCVKYGVKVLTVFAFSTENWIRPKVQLFYSAMAMHPVEYVYSVLQLCLL